jgi:hypothetical protein
MVRTKGYASSLPRRKRASSPARYVRWGTISDEQWRTIVEPAPWGFKDAPLSTFHSDHTKQRWARREEIEAYNGALFSIFAAACFFVAWLFTGHNPWWGVWQR